MSDKFPYRNPRTGQVEERSLNPSWGERAMEVMRDSAAIDSQREQHQKAQASMRKPDKNSTPQREDD